MQIDFHHATTYVVARLAGMGPREANVVAHAAQYVDDATNEGIVKFDTGAMYQRIASAHKMLDYRNFESLADHHVWIPFHFLPGNAGKPAGQEGTADFVDKLICTPDSYVARDVVRTCLEHGAGPGALHRLGITLHVYADTWAHQGFAGIPHAVNLVASLVGDQALQASWRARIEQFFGENVERATTQFLGNVLPLGHGPALSFPDRPYLRWSYRNGRGAVVVRDNPKDFLSAADAMYSVVRRFLARDPDLEASPIPEPDRGKIDECFRQFTDDDGTVRHAKWIALVESGHFSFGACSAPYIATGAGSWREAALGTTAERDDGTETFRYSPRFLESDWKLFHNALQAHRLNLLHDVLPRYGICAA